MPPRSYGHLGSTPPATPETEPETELDRNGSGGSGSGGSGSGGSGGGGGGGNSDKNGKDKKNGEGDVVSVETKSPVEPLFYGAPDPIDKHLSPSPVLQTPGTGLRVNPGMALPAFSPSVPWATQDPDTDEWRVTNVPAFSPGVPLSPREWAKSLILSEEDLAKLREEETRAPEYALQRTEAAMGPRAAAELARRPGVQSLPKPPDTEWTEEVTTTAMARLSTMPTEEILNSDGSLQHTTPGTPKGTHAAKDDERRTTSPSSRRPLSIPIVAYDIARLESLDTLTPKQEGELYQRKRELEWLTNMFEAMGGTTAGVNALVEAGEDWSRPPVSEER
tara:strand:+ start:425 stop:1426 length:1002 start_codon:yes stop_codon:yes gene_type:complete